MGSARKAISLDLIVGQRSEYNRYSDGCPAFLSHRQHAASSILQDITMSNTGGGSASVTLKLSFSFGKFRSCNWKPMMTNCLSWMSRCKNGGLL